MPLVSDVIPALTGGVSQLPAASRIPGKAEICDNAITSIVDGLNKRPPSEYVARLLDYDGTPASANKPLIRFINRDESRRYMVWIQDAIVRVFDLADGSEKTVTMDAGTGTYITTSDPRADLDLLPVGDTSFVWNRGITAANGASASAAAVYDAIIWVKAGAYGRKYAVTINGTEYFYHTPDGSSPWNTPAVDPSFIAEALIAGASATSDVTGGLPAGWEASGDYSAISATSLDDLGAGFTVTQRGSLIRIQSTSDFDIRVEDGQGGAGMTLAKGTVSKLSDLPSKGFDGFLIKVGKHAAESESDYYLEFDDPDDDGTGVWVETIGPGVNLGVNAATLPHRLIHNSDDTFTFSQVPYTQRSTGTEDTAPDPTFVGRNINAVVYLFDRLGFISGEDIHFSGARDLYRFYRATNLTKAEDDPFAITAAADGVSILRHLVSVSGVPVFWSAQRQFQLERTAERFSALGGSQLVDTQAFENSVACRAAEAAGSAYFCVDRGAYSAFREYRPTSATAASVSEEVGIDIPKYVPAGVFQMAGSATEQTLVALAASTPTALFVYRWTDIDNRRLMSGWMRWTIDAAFAILGVGFIGSKLYLALDRTGDGVDLEVINLAPGDVDTGSTFKCRLDGLLTNADVGESYSSATNRTTITLPFDPSGLDLQVAAQATAGAVELTTYEIVASTTTTIAVEGDITALTYYIGRPYGFQFRFSPIYVREGGQDQTGATVRDGRLSISDMGLELVAPYYIDTTVTNEQREPWRKSFLGYNADITDDTNPLVGGKAAFKRFTVAGSRPIIDLTNDTFLPCQIMSATWRGQFQPRSQPI